MVWLPGQRIDHAAGFATLRGAPLRREDEGTNRWVLARGSFSAAAGPAEVRLSVDGQYRAWLDGQPLGRGPVRCSPHFQRFDRYALAWRGGAGVLALLVHVPGVDLGWYETVKGGWQPVFGDGGIYAEFEQGDATHDISWRLFESDAWRRDTPREGWGQDFIEDFDARKLDPHWIDSDFADADWEDARIMVSFGDAAQTARGFGRVEPFPSLLPSELPPPRREARSPTSLVGIHAVAPRPDLPLDRRLYEEEWTGDASDRVEDAAALCSGGFAFVRTSDHADTGLMLAFEPYHAGHAVLEIEADGGEIVEIATAEALPGEYGRGWEGDGLRHEGHLGVARLFRYTARPGYQRFEKFNWAAIRAMEVVVRRAPHGVRLRVSAVATHFNATPGGRFECSDPLLNRLWEVGRHTVLQCMHDGWVDCPGREARQWIGDGVVQFDVAALAFGPSVYPLHRQFLIQGAECQRPDGLLRMFAPGDIAPDALVIPDFSLLWILSAERYFRQSGDLATVERILPEVERALGWFARHADANGLLYDVPHWHFIEWAHLGREGASAPINALHAGALAAAARLAAAGLRPRLAECWREAAALIAASLEGHWDDARGAYIDSVSRTGARGARMSQHANALMLLFDLAAPQRRERILATITHASRLKLTAAPPIVPEGEPFDERRDVVRANSYFAHFVYDGIAHAGGFAWVLDDIRRCYGPMLETGTDTLWESFSPSASLCHGFSASPVYQLSQRVLGVKLAVTDAELITVDPELADLDWAHGIIPTSRGPVEAEWHRSGASLNLSLTYPEHLRPVLADRWTRRLLDQQAEPGICRYSFDLS